MHNYFLFKTQKTGQIGERYQVRIDSFKYLTNILILYTWDIQMM